MGGCPRVEVVEGKGLRRGRRSTTTCVQCGLVGLELLVSRCKLSTSRVVVRVVDVILQAHDLSLHEAVSLSSPPLSSATSNLTEYLAHSFASATGKSYPAICYRPEGAKARSGKGAPAFPSSVPSSKKAPCFVHTNNNIRSQPASSHHPSASQAQVALAFLPGSREEWINTLKTVGEFIDENGVTFEVEHPPNGADDVDIGQMRSGKWVAYAVRALIMRFWALAKVCTFKFLDIILANVHCRKPTLSTSC